MDKKTKIYLLEFFILIVICSFDRKIVLGFLLVFLHEIIHILVAKGFGIDLYSLKLNITGANAEFIDIDETSDKNKLIIYLAGPLFNMIVAIIFIWLNGLIEASWINEVVQINIGLAIFNMLPAYPLDGMRIYEILLSKRILYKKAKKICSNISFLFSIILIGFFFLTVYIHKPNFSLLLVSILIIYTTILEREKSMYILMGNLIKKREKLINNDYIENSSISVYYKKDLVKVLSLVDRNKFNCFFVLDEELKLLEIVYEDELLEGLKEYGNITLEQFIKNTR